MRSSFRTSNSSYGSSYRSAYASSSRRHAGGRRGRGEGPHRRPRPRAPRPTSETGAWAEATSTTARARSAAPQRHRRLLFGARRLSLRRVGRLPGSVRGHLPAHRCPGSLGSGRRARRGALGAPAPPVLSPLQNLRTGFLPSTILLPSLRRANLALLFLARPLPRVSGGGILATDHFFLAQSFAVTSAMATTKQASAHIIKKKRRPSQRRAEGQRRSMGGSGGNFILGGGRVVETAG